MPAKGVDQLALGTDAGDDEGYIRSLHLPVNYLSVGWM